MPTLMDAADAFSKLGKKSVEVREASCVRVRHRGASCDACLRVCSHEAITIENNTLSVDNNLCTGCGACTSACPTEALCLIEDASAAVRAAIDQAEPGTTITITCEYVRNQQTSANTTETNSLADALCVPCLAALDETVAVHAACARVGLHYLTADCAHCPNHNGDLIEALIEQATGMLDVVIAPDIQEQHLHFRWDILHDQDEKHSADTSPEMSRRGMFDHLVARTTDSVAEAFVGTLYVSQHSAEEKPSLAQSLTNGRGMLKTAPVERGALVLDNLFRLNPHLTTEAETTNQADLIPTRLFGEILLKEDSCDLCGICMTFCPTRALSGTPNPPVNPFVSATRAVEVSGELTFRANDCVNCRLCVDICPKNALELHAGIAKNDLFELEPQTLLAK